MNNQNCGYGDHEEDLVHEKRLVLLPQMFLSLATIPGKKTKGMTREEQLQPQAMFFPGTNTALSALRIASILVGRSRARVLAPRRPAFQSN